MTTLLVLLSALSIRYANSHSHREVSVIKLDEKYLTGVTDSCTWDPVNDVFRYIDEYGRMNTIKLTDAMTLDDGNIKSGTINSNIGDGIKGTIFIPGGSTTSNRLFAANSASGTIHVYNIDSETWEDSMTITLTNGGGVNGICYDSNNDVLYATNPGFEFSNDSAIAGRNAIYKISSPQTGSSASVELLDITSIIDEDGNELNETTAAYISLNGNDERQYYPIGCEVRGDKVYFVEYRGYDSVTTGTGYLGVYDIVLDEFYVNTEAFEILGHDVAVYDEYLLATSWSQPQGIYVGGIHDHDDHPFDAFELAIDIGLASGDMGQPNEDGVFCIPEKVSAISNVLKITMVQLVISPLETVRIDSLPSATESCTWDSANGVFRYIDRDGTMNKVDKDGQYTYNVSDKAVGGGMLGSVFVPGTPNRMYVANSITGDILVYNVDTEKWLDAETISAGTSGATSGVNGLCYDEVNDALYAGNIGFDFDNSVQVNGRNAIIVINGLTTNAQTFQSLDLTSIASIEDNATIVQESNGFYRNVTGSSNRQYYPNGCAVAPNGLVYFVEFRALDPPSASVGKVGVYDPSKGTFLFGLNHTAVGIGGMDDIASYGDHLYITSWGTTFAINATGSGSIWYINLEQGGDSGILPTALPGLVGLSGPADMGSPSDDGLFCVPSNDGSSTLTFVQTQPDYDIVETAKIVTVTGYIVDLYCWETNGGFALDDPSVNLMMTPELHTTHCLVEVPVCRDSGFAILEQLEDGTYGIKYRLDKRLNDILINEILSKVAPDPITGQRTQRGYSVTLVGIDDRNGYLRGGVVSIIKPVVDLWCWRDNDRIAFDTKANLAVDPYNHSVHCMYEVSFCNASGFAFVDKLNPNSDLYDILYYLDEELNDELRAEWEAIDDTPGGDRWTRDGYEFAVTAFDDGTGILHHLDEVKTVTGPLVDLYCWETQSGFALDTGANLKKNPLNHTIHCLVEVEVCRTSGYAILQNRNDEKNPVSNITVTYPIVDRFCWETREGITLDTNVNLTTNPLNHTIHCLVEVEVCRDSGYVMVHDDDGDGIWETKYILDEHMNAQVVQQMLDAYPAIIINGNAGFLGLGFEATLTGYDFGDGYLRQYEWDILYKLDETLNAEAVAMMVEDYPAVVINGNAGPLGFGYEITLTGIDHGDGILTGLYIESNQITVTYPIVDRFCWETREGITLDTNVNLTTNPLNHTIHCLVEVEVCRTSGYVMVHDDDGDGIWETKYILDDELNEQVVAQMVAAYPAIIINGNAGFLGLGFEATLTGYDLEDGYLRASEIITTTTEAPDVGGSQTCASGATGVLTTEGTLDNFAVRLDIDCDTEIVTVNVTYSDYSNTWFGLVFADNMIGTALIYTTGNNAGANEAVRDLALYQYNNMAQTPSGVQWVDSVTWTEEGVVVDGSTINIAYSAPIGTSPIGLDQSVIQMRYAIGPNDHQLEYHGGAGRSDDILTLIVGGDGPITVTGPLVDLFCFESRAGITLDTQADLTKNPLNHTIHCLVEVKVCRESGYAIVADDDEDGTWEIKYRLDDALNQEAIAQMLAAYPDLIIDGNAFLPVFGFEITIQGYDSGDGYLRKLPLTTAMGPLVDRLCWEDRNGIALDTKANLNVNPLNHTIHCLVEVDGCRNSGYVIVENLNDEDNPVTPITVTHPIVDRFCWETRNGVALDTSANLKTNPLNHTIHCLVEVNQCRTSGYVMVHDPDNDGVWETLYILDEVFNAEVIDQMFAEYPDLIIDGNANLPYFGFEATLTGYDFGDGYLRNAEWATKYILDDVLNEQAVGSIIAMYPDVILGGNAGPLGFGFEVILSGYDLGDGYLRHSAIVPEEEVTTSSTLAPDGEGGCARFSTLGGTASFEDAPITVTIGIDCATAIATMDITYEGYSDNFFGIVFSDNMIGTALIYTTGNGGNGEDDRALGLYQYNNRERAAGGVQWDESVTWEEQSVVVDGSTIQVVYTAPVDGSPFTLNTVNVQMRWAVGPGGTGIEYHTATGRSSGTLSLNIETGASAIEEDDLSLEYAHGVIMWITWGVLASIGIMSSAFRYLYPMGPTWFKVHRAVQCSVVLFHVIAFIIAIVFTVKKKKDHFVNTHMRFGLIVTILCVLQPLNALLRAHPPSGGWKGGVPSLKRQVWEFVHKKSGYTAWMLGIVTIFLGMELVNAPTLAMVHLFGWGGLLATIYMVLWFGWCRDAKLAADMGSNTTQMTDTAGVQMMKQQTAGGKTQIGSGDDVEESLSINN